MSSHSIEECLANKEAIAVVLRTMPDAGGRRLSTALEKRRISIHRDVLNRLLERHRSELLEDPPGDAEHAASSSVVTVEDAKANIEAILSDEPNAGDRRLASELQRRYGCAPSLQSLRTYLAKRPV